MIYQSQVSSSHRQLKVSRLIQHTIALLLNRGVVFHPLLEKFSLTVLDVKTSVDLKSSTVFISPVNKEMDNNIIKTLNILAPKYRKKLGEKVKLKSLPNIKFEFDKYINEKIKLERLLCNN